MKLFAGVFVCVAILLFPVARASGAEGTDATAQRIDALIKTSHLDSASAICKKILAKDTGNIAALTGLVEVSYLRTQYDSCVVYVNKVAAMTGGLSPQLRFYRGASLGRLGKTDEAVVDLGSFAAVTDNDKIKNDMRAQFLYYQSKQLAVLTKNALTAESTLTSAQVSDSVLAVIPFKNGSADARFSSLQTGLADMIVTDLSQVKGVHIVERVRMQKLLAEIGLDQAGVTRDSERARVAHFFAASKIVGGMYSCPDSVSIKIRGGYMDAAKNSTVSTDPFDGELKDFFSMEKKFVFALIDKMVIKIDDAEREKIQKVPTENLTAFIAYSEGLSAMDKGQFSAAKQSFDKAAKIDPAFKKAIDKSDEAATAQTLDVVAVPAAEAVEPPVVYVSKGPSSAAIAAQTATTTGTKKVSSITPAHRGFNAGGGLGVRTSTLSQGGFMPELAVHASQAAQPAPIANDITEPSATYVRAPYADSHGLTLENKKSATIVIQLPTVVVP